MAFSARQPFKGSYVCSALLPPQQQGSACCSLQVVCLLPIRLFIRSAGVTEGNTGAVKRRSRPSRATAMLSQ